MLEELEKVKQDCLNCQKCPLAKTRTNVVFSDGKPNSNIVLIGEAPGANEDLQGKPFVGRAGQLLDKIFESVGLSREKDIYICNTLKCRPPENRDPLPSEKEACRNYLDAQLNILKPKIILLCGRVALTSFLPNVASISKVRGKWFDGPNGSKMMPIFHPSYLLRNPIARPGSPKALMWEDIKEIKRRYDEILKGNS
ncbi:MAG: uracil-DNA glycosylase [Alphaproteobacteria bacterium]|nr:uracil-DNA glycosylase [Alphaproteobacteria bacterium]